MNCFWRSSDFSSESWTFTAPFRQAKHDAIDDGKRDDMDNGNVDHMRNNELDGALRENVLQILDMTIPEPGFRTNADNFWLRGRIGSGPRGENTT